MTVPAGAPAVPGTTPAEPALSDPWREDLVVGPGVPEVLQVFNRCGLLSPADVHAAIRLSRLAGETDEAVLLAVALAVRAPRLGHVLVDLSDVRSSAVVGDEDLDLEALPWPAPDAWLAAVAASPLVHTGAPPAEAETRPLRLAGTALYLDRYWSDEVALGADLLARAAGRPPTPSTATAADLERLMPGPASADQRQAARTALDRMLCVIAGGPGTGKTTTVARILALLCEEAVAAGERPPLIGLAAPTGKAAARMEEAVRQESSAMDTGDAVRAALSELTGSTLHRLLGPRFDRPGRFRYHRRHRLPHQVVVVDEASMVPLWMMSRLVEAVRPDARLILVGDPDQLVSVEAGAVLADIVGASTGAVPAPARPGPLRESISVLRTNHRFGGALSDLSAAVRAGDPDAVLSVLSRADPAVSWEDREPAELLGPAGAPGAAGAELAGLSATAAWAAEVRAAAAAGDMAGALDTLGRHRVLCAHRRGPAGVAVWNQMIESWGWERGTDQPGGEWFVGRPVLVTANDYSLHLYNGDTGVAVALPPRSGVAAGGDPTLRVVFDARPPVALYSPSRLDSVETVYAMTVHKSQGSEFDHVTLLLPPAGSRLLTRELLYTAVTRARRRVRVIGTEAALRTAVGRPAARASGLGWRLWGPAGPGG